MRTKATERRWGAGWERAEVGELLLLAVEQGEQRARPGSKRRELAGRGCAPGCSRGRGGTGKKEAVRERRKEKRVAAGNF